MEHRRADRAEFMRKPETLTVDVEGFEGPLDLLLELARKQKVDLRRISILELAQQYSEFIRNAENIRMTLAAEYLVMAAWLALIKSRLLLPEANPEEPTGEELAARLAFRLQRLDAMRDASRKLTARRRLGIDFFARGMPERLSMVRQPDYRVSVLELMQAYARLKSGEDYRPFDSTRRRYMAVDAAAELIIKMISDTANWSSLAEFLPKSWAGDAAEVRSATASIFAAALELARSGRLELRQPAAFAQIDIRATRESESG